MGVMSLFPRLGKTLCDGLLLHRFCSLIGYTPQHGAQSADRQSPMPSSSLHSPKTNQKIPCNFKHGVKIHVLCTSNCSLADSSLLPQPWLWAGGTSHSANCRKPCAARTYENMCPNRLSYPPSVEPRLSALADVRVTCPLSPPSSL